MPQKRGNMEKKQSVQRRILLNIGMCLDLVLVSIFDFLCVGDGPPH